MASAAGARCSLAAPTVIAGQRRSASRPPADSGNDPAHGGKQPSAICRAGAAGQREGRRMISLDLSSEEENSTEKGSDLPTPTQETWSGAAESLPLGSEQPGQTCEAHLEHHLWFTPRGLLHQRLVSSSPSRQQWGRAAEGGNLTWMFAGGEVQWLLGPPDVAIHSLCLPPWPWEKGKKTFHL